MDSGTNHTAIPSKTPHLSEATSIYDSAFASLQRHAQKREHTAAPYRALELVVHSLEHVLKKQCQQAARQLQALVAIVISIINQARVYHGGKHAPHHYRHVDCLHTMRNLAASASFGSCVKHAESNQAPSAKVLRSIFARVGAMCIKLFWQDEGLLRGKQRAHLLLVVELVDRNVADHHVGQYIPHLIHLGACAPAAVLLLPRLQSRPCHMHQNFIFLRCHSATQLH